MPGARPRRRRPRPTRRSPTRRRSRTRKIRLMPMRSSRAGRTAMATATSTASTLPKTTYRLHKGPARGPFLFHLGGRKQRCDVIVVPDQGGEVLPVRLEGYGLLVHVEIHVVERPVAEF